jgi:hypothetical protein
MDARLAFAFSVTFLLMNLVIPYGGAEQPMRRSMIDPARRGSLAPVPNKKAAARRCALVHDVPGSAALLEGPALDP